MSISNSERLIIEVVEKGGMEYVVNSIYLWYGFIFRILYRAVFD